MQLNTTTPPISVELDVALLYRDDKFEVLESKAIEI